MLLQTEDIANRVNIAKLNLYLPDLGAMNQTDNSFHYPMCCLVSHDDMAPFWEGGHAIIAQHIGQAHCPSD